MTAAPAVLAEDFTYVVRRGDNPWNLTQRYLKSVVYWPRIQEYNRIPDPTAIPPGTRLRFPIAWMRGSSGAVLVADLRGQAEMQRDADITLLKAGMRIAPGATLRTGANASLTLQYPDGSRTLIGPDASLRLVELKRLDASQGQQVRFELERGQMENAVTNNRGKGGRFIIHTPAAIAAVRGTTFRLAASPHSVRSETLHGVVALHNGKGTAVLRGGTGSHAQTGQAPATPTRLLPSPALDDVPARVERLPVELDIPAVAGAVRYRSQFAPAGGFSVVESDRLSTSARVTSAADLPDGIHRLRVRAIDAHGLEGLDAEREIVIDARPEPPFPTQPPPDGWVVDERPAFRWARSSEPGRYHFQLGADSTFHSPLVDRDDLEAPEWALDQPLAPGQYVWRVALATAAEGQGPFSDPQRFRVPPPGPLPEPPRVGSDTLELRWRAAGENDRYQVQVSSDPAFSNPEFDRETGEPAVSMAKPAPGVHHVRVRTLAPDSPPGPWGKAQQVEIAAEHWRALLIFVPALLLAL
jgi:hypothetical protein